MNRRLVSSVAGWTVLGFASLLVGVAGCTGGAAPTGPTGSSGVDTAASALPHRYRLPAAQAEWEDGYNKQLSVMANALPPPLRASFKPPTDVTFVRFVEPDEAGAEIQAACLRDQGFEATADGDGGLLFPRIPKEQVVAQSEARFRCAVMYPTHPRYSRPLTESQIRTIYDYNVKTLVPCLTREGYSVDVSRIPTWETFRETYETKAMWNSYEPVTQRQDQDASNGVSATKLEAEWRRINEVCPQGPPLDQLWADRN